jgi:serine/threonine protein kinase
MCVCVCVFVCAQGDLHAFLAARRAAGAPLREETVWSVFEQAAAGLAYLHSMRIVHRDIKARSAALWPAHA